jgi:hypothetical protein
MLRQVQGPIAKLAEHPMPAVIAKLMALHDEAEDTARLVTLLQRTLYGAIALALMAAVTLATFHHFGSTTFSWVILMLVATGAVSRCYAMAYNAPFERPALQSFENDLGKVLLMSGVAWGMGAFLVLPHALTGVVALSAIVPSLVLAVLLRARLPVLLFVAPVALMGSLSCLILSGSASGAAMTLLGCSAAAATTILTDRTGGEINFPLAGLSLTSRVFSAVTQR